jgi:RNA polymerase sigma factor (sigma-70 family)
MLSQEFEENVFPLKDRLFRFALVLLRNREEAEDVVQEILARLWSIRARLKQLKSIEAYAIQMVRYECVNRAKSKHRKWTSLDKLDKCMSDHQPEHDLQRKEMFQILLSFISSLPEQQQTVVMLRDVEGLEIHEIESITSMTGNNVRVTLSLARKKIAELYKAYESHERK